jgi:mannose-6-phosphate isomerase-like protein (cupin superfamily)
MKVSIVRGSFLVLAVAIILTLIVRDRAYGHPPGPPDEGVYFSEAPVPGVRIIRLEDYPQRPAHYLSSNLYTTLAAARETGNRFVSFDFQVTPNGGPLPHTHRSEWETFFVFEGEVEFTVGVEPEPPFDFITVPIPAGTVVYGPQGPVHGFVNKSGLPARIFSFAMPAGLDNFFVTSGEPVVDFDAPIPPISQEEIVRTAFWAEQRGDGLHIPNTPPPPVPPTTPSDVVSTITGQDLLTGQDRPPWGGTALFGEQRVSLLTPQEAGNITGATAFCGPGFPGRPGGTVDYSFFSLGQSFDDGNVFPPLVTSNNTEVFYILSGTLWFKFADGIARAPKLTYVEIAPGVPFSLANMSQELAGSIAISVIAPDCQATGFAAGGPATTMQR